MVVIDPASGLPRDLPSGQSNPAVAAYNAAHQTDPASGRLVQPQAAASYSAANPEDTRLAAQVRAEAAPAPFTGTPTPALVSPTLTLQEEQNQVAAEQLALRIAQGNAALAASGASVSSEPTVVYTSSSGTSKVATAIANQTRAVSTTLFEQGGTVYSTSDGTTKIVGSLSGGTNASLKEAVGIETETPYFEVRGNPLTGAMTEIVHGYGTTVNPLPPIINLPQRPQASVVITAIEGKGQDVLAGIPSMGFNLIAPQLLGGTIVSSGFAGKPGEVAYTFEENGTIFGKTYSGMSKELGLTETAFNAKYPVIASLNEEYKKNNAYLQNIPIAGEVLRQGRYFVAQFEAAPLPSLVGLGFGVVAFAAGGELAAAAGLGAGVGQAGVATLFAGGASASRYAETGNVLTSVEAGTANLVFQAGLVGIEKYAPKAFEASSEYVIGKLPVKVVTESRSIFDLFDAEGRVLSGRIVGTAKAEVPFLRIDKMLEGRISAVQGEEATAIAARGEIMTFKYELGGISKEASTFRSFSLSESLGEMRVLQEGSKYYYPVAEGVPVVRSVGGFNEYPLGKLGLSDSSLTISIKEPATTEIALPNPKPFTPVEGFSMIVEKTPSSSTSFSILGSSIMNWEQARVFTKPIVTSDVPVIYRAQFQKNLIIPSQIEAISFSEAIIAQRGLGFAEVAKLSFGGEAKSEFKGENFRVGKGAVIRFDEVTSSSMASVDDFRVEVRGGVAFIESLLGAQARAEVRAGVRAQAQVFSAKASQVSIPFSRVAAISVAVSSGKSFAVMQERQVSRARQVQVSRELSSLKELGKVFEGATISRQATVSRQESLVVPRYSELSGSYVSKVVSLERLASEKLVSVSSFEKIAGSEREGSATRFRTEELVGTMPKVDVGVKTSQRIAELEDTVFRSQELVMPRTTSTTRFREPTIPVMPSLSRSTNPFYPPQRIEPPPILPVPGSSNPFSPRKGSRKQETGFFEGEYAPSLTARIFGFKGKAGKGILQGLAGFRPLRR